MIDEFKSVKELYERVKPALHIKIDEARRNNIYNIREIDVWNYFTEYKWKNANNLMLSDIVDDILNVDLDIIVSYVSNKSQDYDENL